MRRFLLLIIVVLCVGSTKAHSIWISPDGYCQYAVIDFSGDDVSEIKLTDKHRPSLDFISSLLNQYGDQIASNQYQIWVESYVGDQLSDYKTNRDIARKLSNVIKSHFIINNKLIEDNFKTRNYSGTFGGRSYVTVIAIGMRYPIEEIVSKQRLLHYQPEQSDQPITDGDLSSSVDYRKVIAQMNVDTSSILTPNFKVLYFDRDLSKAESHDYTVEPPQKSLSNNHGVLFDDSFNSPELPDHMPPTIEPNQSQKVGDQIQLQARDSDVNIGIGTLAVTPGAVTTIIKITESLSPITSVNSRSPQNSNTRISKHKRDAYRSKVDEQLRSQNELPKQDVSLVKQQTKDETVQLVHKSKPKTQNARVERANRLTKGQSQVAGIVAPTNGGGSVMAFDKILSVDELNAKGVDDMSMGNAEKSSKSNAIDQDPQPMPFAPLSHFGNQEQTQSYVVRSSKRKAKNQPLDGKSIESSLNEDIIAKQKVVQREEQADKDRAVRTLIQRNKAERLRQAQIAKGRFAVAGIGVNLLSSAALIPSVQFDAYFSDRLSVAAEWYYSKWNFNPANVFNISMADVELRYFVLGKKKAFEGLYVGVYGGVGEYDFRWGTQDGHQSQFLSVGLSVGYVLPLGKSGFYFEAGLSGGYVVERIEKYIRYDGGYVNLNEKFNNSTIFAPTKIKLSIIYRIFNQKR